MENNVIEKAEYLKETKNLIKQALQEQGANVSDTDPFRAFASIISNLKTSSGDDAIKVKTGEEIDNMTSEDTLICICSKEYSYTDYDGILVEYKRGVIYEVVNGSANKLLFDTDTTNYRDLDNKPSINGVELINNKSLTELGIQPKGDYALKKDLPRNTSELNDDVGYLTEYTETDPTVPDYVKAITEEDILNWNTKEDPTVPDYVKSITQDDIEKWNNQDYNEFDNKPKINDIELSSNKTLDDLGIQPKGNYLTAETDPIFTASPASSITQEDINKWNEGTGGVAEETDPTVPSHVKNITTEDIEKWNSGGIAEETDPTVPDYVKNITREDIDKWNSGIGSGSSVNIDALPIGSVLLYDGDEIPEGYKELEDYEPTYSLEETKIGTWINGKPLYRKVVQYTLTATDGYPNFDTGIRDIEYAMVDMYKSDGGDTNTDYFRPSAAVSNYLSKSSGFITFIVVSDAGLFKAEPGLYTFVIQYTKTTDEGV